MRTLTLEDRRKIELMWRRSASSVKIAAELEISQCTVYTELKRGQETDDGGGVVAETGREAGRGAGPVHQGQGGVPYPVGPGVLHHGREAKGDARPLRLL